MVATLIELLRSTPVATLHALAQWRYGVAGLMALALLRVGIRRRNAMCSAVAAMILAALVTRPAL